MEHLSLTLSLSALLSLIHTHSLSIYHTHTHTHTRAHTHTHSPVPVLSYQRIEENVPMHKLEKSWESVCVCVCLCVCVCVCVWKRESWENVCGYVWKRERERERKREQFCQFKKLPWIKELILAQKNLKRRLKVRSHWWGLQHCHQRECKLPGSAISNGREPRSCLGRVFNI